MAHAKKMAYLNQKNKLHTMHKSTTEYERVLKYVQDVLVNEFPTDSASVEYLILSILDNKNCHANMILDNCMMSNNLSELRSIYEDVIKRHVNIQADVKNCKFDGELTRLLDTSKRESSKMKSEFIGTEHILLAILNRENGFNAYEVFERFGIDYNFIFDKCRAKQNDEPKKKKIEVNASQNLKSQVNVKKSSISTKTEEIKKYTIDVNEMIRDGKVDELVGRDKEINEIIKTLSRRKKNNVILVGNSGCGKTSIVFKIAKMIEEGDVPSVLDGKEIVMLNQLSIIGGTTLRGMFEERVNMLFDELKANDKYILFIDDIHNVLRSSSKEKDGDLSGMLPNILNDGRVKVIATTTYKDYKNAVENNSSIARSLQKIIIEQATKNDAVEIIKKVKKNYEEYHNVFYNDSAITTAVELADRYITDRSLPDSAIDVIDMAGASTVFSRKDNDETKELKRKINELEVRKQNAMNSGDFESVDVINDEVNKYNMILSDIKRENAKNSPSVIEINEEIITKTVAEITNIPIEKLSSNDKKKIANIDSVLKQSVIGQDEAVETVCKVIKRNKVGLSNKQKTLGTLLLLGPSGCGKTLIAKKLAEEVFGDERALIRIDMSEYSEKSSVSKLTGSAPGYIGFENGGQLTEAVKRKQYCVLLLDEIEKANEEVHNLFLQLFDEGRLTDSAGQTVNFKNVIVLMTSNVGARKANELGNGVGFVTDKDNNKKSIIEKELKNKFTPEFLNRIDKIVYFNNLTDDNLKDIVKLEIDKFKSRLNNINLNILYTDSVIDFIHKEAIKEKEFGARPIIRIVQNNIEDKVTELMLANEYEPNYTFSATCENGSISIK